jgi:hypothetical protein
MDPSGDESLREAKRVRKTALRAGGEEELRGQAQLRFGMPASSLPFARELPAPLYLPMRAVKS